MLLRNMSVLSSGSAHIITEVDTHTVVAFFAGDKKGIDRQVHTTR